MIVSVQELPDFPATPSTGDQVFNTSLDAVYTYAPGAAGALQNGWLQTQSGASLRESQRITDTLVKAKYAGKDYQTFIDELSANVVAQFGDVYNDFLTASVGMMLIKLFSSAMDTMSWNLDFRGTEWFMFLANLRSTIARKARELGYKPNRAVSASIDLDLTLTDGPYAFPILVKGGFQFNGPNGLVFEQRADLVFPVGTKKITAVGYFQGQTLKDTFTSDGTENQQFRLRKLATGQWLAGGVKVFVNNAQWDEYDFLPFDQVNGFEVGYDTDPLFVRTGDGVVGNVPPAGASVVVTYVVTNGRAGNTVPRNSVKTPRNALTANFQGIAIVAAHDGTSSGGEDPEDPRSVQANAPRVFATAQRAVSQDDWDALVNTFSDPTAGAVARGKAQVIRGISNELTMLAMLAAIRAAGAGNGALAQIKVNDQSIRTAAGFLSTVLKPGYVSLQGQITQHANSALAALVDYNTQSAALKLKIAEIKAAVSALAFAQVLGFGDGTTLVFNATLVKLPLTPGTVTVACNLLTPIWFSNSGDVTTDPGAVSSTGNPTFFQFAQPGDLVKIGADYRRIIDIVDPGKVHYSGPVIPATGALHLTLFARIEVLYDDGAGGLSGPTATGTVNYATGVLQVTFTMAPAGTTLFGQPITAFYRYADAGAQAIADDILALVTTEDTDVTNATTDLNGVNTANAAQNYALLDSGNATISGLATQNDQQVQLAEQTSTNVNAATDALQAYLDKALSGDCKANIVQVRALAHDKNGDYVSPTQTLLTALRLYLESKKIISVTVSAVDGIQDLLAVDYTVKLEIEAAFLYANVWPQVDALVTGLFKDRLYGAELKESDIWKLIVPNADGTGGVKGVKSAVVRLTKVYFKDSAVTKQPPSISDDGVLLIEGGQILVKGVPTYSEMVITTV